MTEPMNEHTTTPTVAEPTAPESLTRQEMSRQEMSRQEMADWAREEVIEATAVLLEEVHDIDFHHYGDGPVDWLDGERLEGAAEAVLQVADRLADSARIAAAAIRASLARREWLLAGRPLRCPACDEVIEAELDTWRVCRGHAEHRWCHQDDPDREDGDRACMREEAEHAAYLEDRARTGGPRTGDIVQVTYPDGTRQYAVWQTGPDGTGTARTDAYHAHPVDLTTATGIEIIELAEDAGTPPPDGAPVDPVLLATLHTAHADGFGTAPTCGACRQSLPPRPARRLGSWSPPARPLPARPHRPDHGRGVPVTGTNRPDRTDRVDDVRGLRGYGPLQFPDRLGLSRWEFERAVRDGLIPAADPGTGRWPAAMVEAAAAEVEAIRAAIGTHPDVGAVRAAGILRERFGIDVRAETVVELDRKGLIRAVGDYKGHPLYDGRALETFTDLHALQNAVVDGRLLTRGQVAAALQVRVCDITHLIRAHWLEPVTHAHSVWQSRRSAPAVALFRAGDLDVLAHHPGIDWDAVRATPPGRPSPLAVLTTTHRPRRTQRSHRGTSPAPPSPHQRTVIREGEQLC